jgi:hypothetical protein
MNGKAERTYRYAERRTSGPVSCNTYHRQCKSRVSCSRMPMMPVAVRATSRGPRIEACGEKSGRREWRLVVFLPRIAIQCMECLLFVCLLWARFQLVLLPTWTERFGRARPADRARHAAGGSHCCCRRGGPQSREGRRLYYRLLVMSPPFQLSDRGSLSGAGLCVVARKTSIRIQFTRSRTI